VKQRLEPGIVHDASGAADFLRDPVGTLLDPAGCFGMNRGAVDNSSTGAPNRPTERCNRSRERSRRARPIPCWAAEGAPVDTLEPRLFSVAALEVLDQMPHDPTARGRYEWLSGGLMWPDEFPRPGSAARAIIGASDLYRFLLAYRASITLQPERAKPYHLWEQLTQHAPNWPGLRPERRGELAARRLWAAHRLRDKCLMESDSPSVAVSQEAEPGAAADGGA
jgi:hypothetical protein